jgi:predicted nucleic acid-binding protein
VVGLAAVIPRPPQAMQLPRDPKDEPLIDIAVAGAADYLVTWNHKHLTYLMAGDTPEGREFLTRFPTLRIVSPVDLLNVLDTSPPARP